MSSRFNLRDILVSDFLFRLGKIEKNQSGMFLCPYREEANKSFLILRDGRTFQDFSMDDKPQSLITLIDRMGIATIPNDKKGWYEFSETIRKIMGVSKAYVPPKIKKVEEVQQEWETKEITDTRLINYLISRGVSESIYKRLEKDGLLKQVEVTSKKGKKYSYIGLKNIRGGYTCRNKIMKSSVGKTGISKVIGKDYIYYISNSASNLKKVIEDIRANNITSTVIFEGMFDFLSFVSNPANLSLLDKHNKHNLVLDNGLGGDRATITTKLELGINNVKDLRKSFALYEDFNDFMLGKKGVGKYPRFALFSRDNVLHLVEKKEEKEYPIIWTGYDAPTIKRLIK